MLLHWLDESFGRRPNLYFFWLYSVSFTSNFKQNKHDPHHTPPLKNWNKPKFVLSPLKTFSKKKKAFQIHLPLSKGRYYVSTKATLHGKESSNALAKWTVQTQW